MMGLLKFNTVNNMSALMIDDGNEKVMLCCHVAVIATTHSNARGSLLLTRCK